MLPSVVVVRGVVRDKPAQASFLDSTFPSSQVPGGSQDPTPGGPRHPQPVCQLQCPAAGHQEAAHGGKCSRSLCTGQFPGGDLALLIPELCDSSSQQPGLGLPNRAQGTWEGSGLEERGGGPQAAWSHLQGQSSLPHTSLAALGSFLGLFFTRNQCLPKLPASLGIPTRVSLAAFLTTKPPSPDPEKLSHLGHRSQGKGDRQTSLSPGTRTCQTPSFPPLSSRPSPSLPSALPVLPDNFQPSTLASCYF